MECDKCGKEIRGASVVVDYTIQLAWEAPGDPDINFYRIYRSTTPSFPADETTEIGVVTDLEYFDSGLSPNTYYYKVAAVDFSGNIGDLSSEVNAAAESPDEERLAELRALFVEAETAIKKRQNTRYFKLASQLGKHEANSLGGTG